MSEIKYIKKRTTRNALEALRPDASDYDTDEEYSAVWDMWADCCTVIDGATPDDVAPVIHGRWVITHDFDDNKAAMVPLGRVVRCSICGYPENGAESKYCPHCGAKMDEEVK